MICPNCGKDNNIVERPFYKNGIYHRRRMCKGCGERFITTEYYVSDTRVPRVEVLRSDKTGLLNLSVLKHRSRQIWLTGLVTGWGIISDVEDGDFYIYTSKGGQWLSGATYRTKWWAYDTIKEDRRSVARD